MDTIGDKSVANDTDIKAKYIKFIAGSLSALTLVVETIGVEKQLSDSLQKIISDPKFWKFCRDKEPAVRFAWFKFVAAVVRTCPELAMQHAKKLCSSTFSNLSDHDPVSASAVWESALSIIVSENLKV